MPVSRQGSLLVGVNLSQNLKPHIYEQAGLCGSPSCVLTPRQKASSISKIVPFFIKLPSEPGTGMDLRWLVVFYLTCSKSCPSVQSKNSWNGLSSQFLAWQWTQHVWGIAEKNNLVEPKPGSSLVTPSHKVLWGMYYASARHMNHSGSCRRRSKFCFGQVPTNLPLLLLSGTTTRSPVHQELH